MILSSCSNPFVTQSQSEVNFTELKDVQLTYNHNIYNVKINFSRSVLSLSFGNNGTAFDGISYKVTPDSCQITFSGLVHSFEKTHLPDNYLPVLIWQFFYENSGDLITENFDSQKGCCFLTRTINDSFIRFEVYENESNVSYTLIIT